MIKIRDRKTTNTKTAKLADFVVGTASDILDNRYTVETAEDITSYSSRLDPDYGTLSLIVEYSNIGGYEAEPKEVVIDLQKEANALGDRETLLINLPITAMKAVLNALGAEGIRFNHEDYQGVSSLKTDFFEIDNNLCLLELRESSNEDRYYLKLFKLRTETAKPTQVQVNANGGL